MGGDNLKHACLVFLAFGLIVLFALFAEVDWVVTLEYLAQIGWVGAAIIVVVTAIAFQIDVMTWHLLLLTVPFDIRWSFRLWRVSMVGEALGLVTPLGQLSGEPAKLFLLKRYHGVSFRDAAIALILIHGINGITLVPFVIVGIALMATTKTISTDQLAVAQAACAILVAALLLILLILRFDVCSRLAQRLQASRGLLAGIVEFGQKLETSSKAFVGRHRRRLASVLCLGFLLWVFGALEVFLILWFIGEPLSLADCWIIESVVVLVRAATFFIPGNLGTQDGAIALAYGSIAGALEIGLAVALIRRAREIAWALGGLGIGWHMIARRPSG